MGKFIRLEKGDMVGDHGINFIKELPRERTEKGIPVRMCLFKCSCGNYFKARFHSVRHNHKKSCGCLINKSLTSRNTTHGLSKSKLYSTWGSMISRCYNKNRKYYKYYGGKGVAVCDKWRYSFKAFYDDVVKLPNCMKDGYTLDRIDSNGDYTPYNIRWATAREQSLNRTIKPSKSGYIGVTLHRVNKWASRLRKNGQSHNIGYFDTIENAIIARDIFILEMGWENEYPLQYIKKDDYKKMFKV